MSPQRKGRRRASRRGRLPSGQPHVGVSQLPQTPYTTAGSLRDPKSCPCTRCSFCFETLNPCLPGKSHSPFSVPPRHFIRLQCASLPSAPRPLGTPLLPCHTSGCPGPLEHDCPPWATGWHPAQGGPRDQAQHPTGHAGECSKLCPVAWRSSEKGRRARMLG